MKKIYLIALMLLASCSLMAMEESHVPMDIDSTVSITSDIEKIREAALEEIQHEQYGKLTPFLLDFFAHAQNSKFKGSAQDFLDLVCVAVRLNHSNVINFLKHFHILDSQLITFIRFRQSIEVIKILIDAGADVNYNENWISPLIAAVCASRSKENTERSIKLLKMLMEAGANVNQINIHETALSSAVVTANIEIIEFLLLNGADSDLPNKGRLLRSACQMANTGLIEFILALPGEDINHENQGAYNGKSSMVDFGSSSALSCAIFRDRLETVSLLHKHGANINKQDRLGWSPLMQASAAGFPHIVSLLLSLGAESTAMNKRGQTALDLAKKWRNKKTGDNKENFKSVIQMLKFATYPAENRKN